MMRQDHADLIHLPVDEAVALKYERGLLKYRTVDEPFRGEPLLELHDECLDGLAYAAVAAGQGAHTDTIREHLTSALTLVRSLIRPKPPHSVSCVDPAGQKSSDSEAPEA